MESGFYTDEICWMFEMTFENIYVITYNMYHLTWEIIRGLHLWFVDLETGEYRL